MVAEAADPTRLRVRVRLPDGAPAPARGRVRVRIEDVTRADAPAPELAAADFPPSGAGDGTLGPFELNVSLAGGDYAVRVHVDRSGDGRIVPGDLVSVARHPVKPAATTQVEVPVRPVPDDPTR